MSRKRKSNYKVMACFDIETNNDFETKSAYAITYQLSVLTSHLIPCSEIDNENVNSLLNVTIDRDFADVTKRFDELIMYGKANGIVPVIMVHNLAFEMWVLSPYISSHEADGCAKSTVKPLTINIKEEGQNVLVFWDTLSFWGKSLGKLGDECKYPKLSGCWDYNKQRNPTTYLTDAEYAYAREDVIVPWSYLGYYLRLNPEIDEHVLACKILTKTSAVRYKSMKRCGNIRVNNKTTAFMWTKQNRQEKPKSDYELEMTHSATRGGFTYCAANTASKVFHKTDTHRILKYDANSMHICHALAHKVPFNYREKAGILIKLAFNKVRDMTYQDILDNYSDPFPQKFFARFHATNVRLKAGSVFERDGISTFAASRFSTNALNVEHELITDNEGGYAFNQKLADLGWHDTASKDAKFAFGKFYGASDCVLILNELSAWEFVQQFDYDSIEVIGTGYLTGRSTYATDKSVLSFNEFYKAKTEFKRMKERYERQSSYDDLDIPSFVPGYLTNGMLSYDSELRTDVDAFYLSVKAELNALYGIEATNEAKNEVLLTKDGYELGEYKGVEGLPDYPKAWYQYGTHIVGWSRIHQILFMLILKDVVSHFICGDTDSHKIFTRMDSEGIERLLEPLHNASRRAIDICTARAKSIKSWYPMDGLGYYECEGEVDGFAASWNKSYIQLIGDMVDITMAGIPCDNKFQLADGTIVNHSYNRCANWFFDNGMPFDDVANLFIGYNVNITHNITGLNQRKLPEWNTWNDQWKQPCAIYIYPMTKIIGNTDTIENYINVQIATRNNPCVNTTPTIIDWPLEDDKPCIIKMEELV